MERFPTAAHLASWAGMAPGNNITGGKRHSGKTTKVDTYLSAQLWRLAKRLGKKNAAVAVGHSILVICGTCSATTATTPTSAATTSLGEETPTGTNNTSCDNSRTSATR